MTNQYNSILLKFHPNNSNELVKLIQIDSVFFYYLWKELKISRFYCKCFKRTQQSNKIRLLLLPTKYDLIDYNWNDRVSLMVRERCELDHALSWLSTLGGAFSALGDYYIDCAQIAGKISLNQFRLAMRLDDPTIIGRCRLYLSLSLIQQRRFKLAKTIIQYEYENAKRFDKEQIDSKLLRMCRGIWSKLQYEHQLNRIERTKMKQMNL